MQISMWRICEFSGVFGGGVYVLYIFGCNILFISEFSFSGVT